MKIHYDRILFRQALLMLTFFMLMSTLFLSAKNPIKVACIGNSITYGTGIEDRDMWSYPSQLQRLLGEGYSVGNFGKPGATLLRHGHRPYMYQEEFRNAMRYAADIAVIHLGINDTDPRNWPNYRDEFVRDYLSLIDSLKSVNHNVRIIIARMTPIADRHPRFISGTKLWHGEIQSAIETVAKVSDVEMIDLHEPLYPYPDLLPDGLHPNEEGAGLMAKTVYSGITGDYGGLMLSPLYSDYMVLQRDIPLDIHGTANAGVKVKVSIAGQTVYAITNNRGEWSVELSPLSAGEDYTLAISDGHVCKEYRHVAVGEVWLCSGQSNMAFRLDQAATAKTDVPKAYESGLRLYDMKGRWTTYDKAWPADVVDSLRHLQYFRETSWTEVTPENASRFSAIAYHFGKMLRDSLQVPVGLICNAVGGSPAESWIDRNTLETCFPAILKDWLHNDFIQQWARERASKNLANDTLNIGRHPYQPCYLYESGIMSMQQYPIKGVIWYQGESNAHNFEAHEDLFRLLVESWRRNWHNDEMPFYYVQLSSINRPSWPWFRDSQRRMMGRIQFTGMAVSSDLGDSIDVHPIHKKEIGLRLGRWALNKTYNQQITPSGPLFKNAFAEGSELVVSFDYAKGLKTSDGKEPACFEIAEHDGLFFPADAVIEGEQIRLSSPKVQHPRLVRYAWQPFTRANLVNEEGLPASTFREEL